MVPGVRLNNQYHSHWKTVGHLKKNLNKQYGTRTAFPSAKLACWRHCRHCYLGPNKWQDKCKWLGDIRLKKIVKQALKDRHLNFVSFLFCRGNHSFQLEQFLYSVGSVKKILKCKLPWVSISLLFSHFFGIIQTIDLSTPTFFNLSRPDIHF